MKNTIKVRTFLGQAIDTFKEYIKTKGNLQTDYPLEKYMEEILDYIDYLEKENKQLKDNWNKLKEYVSNSLKFYKETDDEYVKTQREFGIRDGYKIVSGKIQELEGSDSNE